MQLRKIVQVIPRKVIVIHTHTHTRTHASICTQLQTAHFARHMASFSEVGFSFSKKMLLACSSLFVAVFATRGDGRAVPRELDRKTADAAEVDLRLEEIGMSNMTR